MNKLKLVFVAMAALFAVQIASAETVSRALVTAIADGVGLFNVDENDVWTFDRWIVPIYSSASNPNGPRRPVRAVYRDGIIYVADSMSSSAETTSYVRKYTLQGEYLGDLCEFAGCIDGMVFSRDGKYLFASKFAANKGGLSRYEIATGEWTHYLTNYMGIQQLAVDDSGRLFVACRYTNNWEGGFEVFDIETMTNIKSWRGKSLPNCWGCGWNPADGNVYVCYTTKNWGVFDTDGERIVPSTEANVDIGWCFGVGYVNGKMYYGSKNSNIYRMDNVDLTTPSATFTCVYTGSNWRGDKMAYDVSELTVLDATERWSFEESVGSAKCAASVTGAGAVLGESGFTPGVAGGIGSCAYFTGAGSRAVLADSEAFVPETADFTIAFWTGLPAGDGVRHLFSNSTGAAGDFAVVANADDTLGLSFTPVGAAEAITIETERTVADGTWHQVAVRRAGTALELYLDGARVGTAAVAATDKIAQDRPWHCGSKASATGGFVGAGAFMDELTFFGTALLQSEILSLYQKAQPTAVPTAPALPTASDPLDPALGAEIAHAFSYEAPFGSPGFLIAGDTWYVCADRANERYAADQSTRVWTSRDQGATWTEIATVPGSGVSLCLVGSTPAAIGLKADGTGRTFAVWTYAEGTWTEAASSTYATGRFASSSAAVCEKDSKIWKAVSYQDANGKLWPANVSACVTNLSDFTVRVRTDAAFVRSNASSTLVDVPGGTMTEWTNHSQPVAIFPFVDRKSAGVGQQTGVERACYHIVSLMDGGYRNHYLDMFRGGAKPFSVRYDATSKLYWTVTAPVVDSSRLLSEPADGIVDRLAVYTSPDLAAWTPCGEILAPVTSTGFIPGVFEIAGDDLIVAYAVAADDGVGGLRTTTAGNYLAWKRISGFRTALVPVEMNPKRFALLCDGESTYNDYDYYAPRLVRRYYATADGEWQPGGIFAEDTLKATTPIGDLTLSTPTTPVVRGNSIYILSGETKPVRIFEFGWKGNLKRVIFDPDKNGLYPRAMDLAPDGRSALIVTRDPARVVRMDLATGRLTVLVEGDANLNNPFRVTASTDGTFYVSNYDWSNPVGGHYAADGTRLGTISKSPNYMTTINYDAQRNKVYCGDIYGSVRTVDAETLAVDGPVTTRNVQYLGSNYTSAFVSDRLYLGARYGYLSAFDVETGAETAPFATLNSVTGIAIFEKVDLGLMLFVR